MTLGGPACGTIFAEAHVAAHFIAIDDAFEIITEHLAFNALGTAEADLIDVQFSYEIATAIFTVVCADEIRASLFQDDGVDGFAAIKLQVDLPLAGDGNGIALRRREWRVEMRGLT